ncbi:MAG TPA: hypothetical protein VFU21_04385 [Kofleriaceae bacterium]|nr:hypothetical protein [Kofleriaceae bacterium]
MRLHSLLVCLLAAAAPACQRGSDSASPAYRADIENICDAEARSGALAPDQDPNRRAFVVATWLPGRIRSDEGRQFLGSLQKLSGGAKGDALRREAARVGLSACPLAETWK